MTTKTRTHSELRETYGWDTPDTYRIGCDPAKPLSIHIDENVAGPRDLLVVEHIPPRDWYPDRRTSFWSEVHGNLGSLDIPSICLPLLLEKISRLAHAARPILSTSDQWNEIIDRLTLADMTDTETGRYDTY